MKRFKLVTVKNKTGKEIIICDTVTGYKWRHINPSSYAGYYTAYQRIK